MIETKMNIHGVAIRPGVSRNGITYLKEELDKFSKTMENKPILVDHKSDNIMNNIGLLTKSQSFDGEVHYEGWIKENGMGVMDRIKDGRLKEVSIGATVERIVEDEDGNYIAEGMECMELSIVSCPGVRGTSLKQALENKNKKLAVSEKLSDIKKVEKQIVDKVKEEVIMAEEQEQPTEQPKEEVVEQPKEEVVEQPKEETKVETVESKKIELDIDSSKIDEAIKKAEKLLELRQKLKESDAEEPVKEEPVEEPVKEEPAEEVKEEPVEEPVKEEPAEEVKEEPAEEVKEEPAEEPEDKRSEENMSTKGKIEKKDVVEAREEVAGSYICERSELGGGYSLFRNPNADGHYKKQD